MLIIREALFGLRPLRRIPEEPRTGQEHPRPRGCARWSTTASWHCARRRRQRLSGLCADRRKAAGHPDHGRACGNGARSSTISPTRSTTILVGSRKGQAGQKKLELLRAGRAAARPWRCVVEATGTATAVGLTAHATISPLPESPCADPAAGRTLLSPSPSSRCATARAGEPSCSRRSRRPSSDKSQHVVVRSRACAKRRPPRDDGAIAPAPDPRDASSRRCHRHVPFLSRLSHAPPEIGTARTLRRH